MGRGYIVEDTVEGYLSTLCEQHAGPVTGLLIGQSSTQRDFVVTATRTPRREESGSATGGSVDREWVTEHARQVSRMLPGGLSVLGVFIITDTDSKDALTTLRQLVFSVENLVSSERLWSAADDDVTERVALHVNPKTRKTFCRSFDVRDPKSAARPADWKYQTGVSSSWTSLSCCLLVDLLVPLAENTDTHSLEESLKEELTAWTRQVERGVCLIDGRKPAEDAELPGGGQKRNVRQTHTAQLLITPDVGRSGDQTSRPCGGSAALRGAVHCRAFLPGNKAKARTAEKLLKRDAVSTVACRVQMLLEDLLTSEDEVKHHRERLCLPQRVFCPLGPGGPLAVCDYRFSDEDPAELTERFKEMLDLDVREDDLDQRLETPGEDTETPETPGTPGTPGTGGAAEHFVEVADTPEPKRNNFTGVVMATAVALLASAASLLYLSDV